MWHFATARRTHREDRIRTAKDTGLTNRPLHGFGASRIWIEIVSLTAELIAWMQSSHCTTTPPVGALPRLHPG